MYMCFICIGLFKDQSEDACVRVRVTSSISMISSVSIKYVSLFYLISIKLTNLFLDFNMK